jgi:glutathione S-transferase
MEQPGPTSSNIERTIYQFPISHFSEKARWCLDAKGLAYRVHNVVPGLHVLRVPRISGGARTVPVLVDRGTPVGDSSAIALYLEDTYPDPPLLPRDQGDRDRALSLEDFFDEGLGQSVKRWLYGELMEVGPGRAVRALFEAYPWPVRIAGKLMAPGIEKAMRAQEGIHPEGLERARVAILEAADRLEHETGGDPSRYLVGGALTLADITAASLFAPLVAPPESPYARTPSDLPPSVEAMGRALRDRPAGRWVMERYRLDRRRAGTSKSEARKTSDRTW